MAKIKETKEKENMRITKKEVNILIISLIGSFFGGASANFFTSSNSNSWVQIIFPGISLLFFVYLIYVLVKFRGQ